MGISKRISDLCQATSTGACTPCPCAPLKLSKVLGRRWQTSLMEMCMNLVHPFTHCVLFVLSCPHVVQIDKLTSYDI